MILTVLMMSGVETMEEGLRLGRPKLHLARVFIYVCVCTYICVKEVKCQF